MQRPVLVRSNSINVASVIRSRCASDSISESSISESSLHDERIVFQDETNDEKKVLHHRRRNSLNVASFLRSRNREDELYNDSQPASWSSPITTKPSCVVVDNATIQQHTVVQYNNCTRQRIHDVSLPADEEMNMASLGNENNVVPKVQFRVPTDVPTDDSDCDDLQERTVLRHKAVTFGAYYDDQNGDMIPELVQADMASMDSPEQQQHKHVHIIMAAWHGLAKNVAKAHPASQMLSTVLACLLTFAVTNRPPNLDSQITTMVLVTLCGSTFPHLVAAVACGVYAGSVESETIRGFYPYVLLLGIVTAIVWQLISSFGILLGFSGRLGASAFMAMNVTALVVFSLDSDLSFDAFGSSSTLWDETLSWQEAFFSMLASIFLASSAGFFRLTSSVPVNPILVPSAWALFCMLVTSITEFRYTASVLQGFAVGAYAAMASEARVPSTARFAMVGILAGIWNMLLQPFFLGFGGKAGFTSMLGYSTYLLFKTIYKKRLKRCLKNAGGHRKRTKGKQDDSSGPPIIAVYSD